VKSFAVETQFWA